MRDMRVVWTLPATAHLKSIHEFISESSSAAADRQMEMVIRATMGLVDFPERGRPGRRRTTRELVVAGTPYIVAYRIRIPDLVVLAVIHGARRWPRYFDE